jgi:hypothetical protein
LACPATSVLSRKRSHLYLTAFKFLTHYSWTHRENVGLLDPKSLKWLSNIILLHRVGYYLSRCLLTIPYVLIAVVDAHAVLSLMLFLDLLLYPFLLGHNLFLIYHILPHVESLGHYWSLSLSLLSILFCLELRSIHKPVYPNTSIG